MQPRLHNTSASTQKIIDMAANDGASTIVCISIPNAINIDVCARRNYVPIDRY
jgi:hypothetical protein